VIFAVPGVLWSDIEAVQPPHLLEATRDGAAGSISVRTAGPSTSEASGFATIGAGSRVATGAVSGRASAAGNEAGVGPLETLAVRGLDELRALAASGGYDARPGALGAAIDSSTAAVGNSNPGKGLRSPLRLGSPVLLAAMDESGTVERAAIGDELLVKDQGAPFGVRTDPDAAQDAVTRSLKRSCGLTVVTEGDLVRADQEAFLKATPRSGALRASLLAADSLLGEVRKMLDEDDLLVIVSPTSRLSLPQAHLGVAIAVGPEFSPGSSLQSASTRRATLVTLPDVAPTILEHLGVRRPSFMTGRPFFAIEAGSNRVQNAVELDRESVFVDAAGVGIVRGFLAYSLAFYLVAAAGAYRAVHGHRMLGPPRVLELLALSVVAFPLATYLAGTFQGHLLGFAGFLSAVVAIDLALVIAALVCARDALARMLVLNAATLTVVMADLFTGSRLQMNTILGYSPIVAGRFAGIGNLSFAVLAAAALITGSLIVHRAPRSARALGATAALFAAVVVADGAPPFGSDVGGTIALVPGLGFAVIALAGRRVGPRLLVGLAVGGLVVLAAFLVFDLSRPPEERTHLARLFETVDQRGLPALTETLQRKLMSNLRLLTSSVWALPVLPGLAAAAGLLALPRATWERVRRRCPAPFAGVVAGALVAVLGFALNDSGIAIPSAMLFFFVPMALALRHMCGERLSD